MDSQWRNRNWLEMGLWLHQRVTAQLVLGPAGTGPQLCPLAAAVVTCPPHFNDVIAAGRGVGFSNCHSIKLLGSRWQVMIAMNQLWSAATQVLLGALRKGAQSCGPVLGPAQRCGQFPLSRRKSRLWKDCKATCEDALQQPRRLWPDKISRNKCSNSKNSHHLFSITRCHALYI